MNTVQACVKLFEFADALNVIEHAADEIWFSMQLYGKPDVSGLGCPCKECYGYS